MQPGDPQTVKVFFEILADAHVDWQKAYSDPDAFIVELDVTAAKIKAPATGNLVALQYFCQFGA